LVLVLRGLPARPTRVNPLRAAILETTDTTGNRCPTTTSAEAVVGGGVTIRDTCADEHFVVNRHPFALGMTDLVDSQPRRWAVEHCYEALWPMRVEAEPVD
jgi:hypothetical protein